MILKCRLCFSQKYLISLFNGKYRMNRNYLRKFIELTTGIKIQEDGWSCVCLNCCILSCNFYKFQCLSRENDKLLKEYSKDEMQDLIPYKIGSKYSFFEIIEGWLRIKKKCCNEQSIETKVNSEWKNSFQVQRKLHDSNKFKDSNNGTRIKSRQILLQSNFKNSETQTSIVNTSEAASQTESLHSPLQLTLLKHELDISSDFKPSPTISEKLTNDYAIENFSRTLQNGKSDSIFQNEMDSSTSLLSISSKTTSVQICNVCDKTIYSSKNMKTHMKQHMKCSMCKRTFRTLSATQQHIKNECELRQFELRIPIIKLTRLEDERSVSSDILNYLKLCPADNKINHTSDKCKKIKLSH